MRQNHLSSSWHTLAAVILALAGVLTAADVHARAEPAGDDPTEFRGRYVSRFEGSWFRRCGAAADDALWWVTLSDHALRQRDSLTALHPGLADGNFIVRLRGTVSGRMPAGHLGRGTRYLHVTELLRVEGQAPDGRDRGEGPPPRGGEEGAACHAPHPLRIG